MKALLGNPVFDRCIVVVPPKDWSFHSNPFRQTVIRYCSSDCYEKPCLTRSHTVTAPNHDHSPFKSIGLSSDIRQL